MSGGRRPAWPTCLHCSLRPSRIGLVGRRVRTDGGSLRSLVDPFGKNSWRAAPITILAGVESSPREVQGSTGGYSAATPTRMG